MFGTGLHLENNIIFENSEKILPVQNLNVCFHIDTYACIFTLIFKGLKMEINIQKQNVWKI